MSVRISPPARKKISDVTMPLKNGKAVRVDSITAEVLKVDVNLITVALHLFFLLKFVNKSRFLRTGKRALK